jgi:uncharacterized membrane protein
LLIFIGYQLYRMALQPSAALIVLTVFDALIVMLTWLEYRRQRRIPKDRASGSTRATSANVVQQ